MDDSERSYGYSRDLYHGRHGPGGQYGVPYRRVDFSPYYPNQLHWERSYEYGLEWSPADAGEADVSPEEQALHLVEDRGRRWYERPRSGGRVHQIVPDAESFDWFAPGPYAGRGPRNYRRSDASILEKVSQRLCDDPEVDASDITVMVENGEVTLEGTVPSRRMKRLAEGDAEVVRGVVDVHNRLRIAPGEHRAGNRPETTAGACHPERSEGSGRGVISPRGARQA